MLLIIVGKIKTNITYNIISKHYIKICVIIFTKDLTLVKGIVRKNILTKPYKYNTY